LLLSGSWRKKVRLSNLEIHVRALVQPPRASAALMPRSIGPLLEAIDIFLRATNLRQLRQVCKLRLSHIPPCSNGTRWRSRE
jgi:hypothetical protein